MNLPEKMKALVIEADKVLTYKDVPVPEIGEDDVLIRVHACGICGSDIPRVLHGGAHFYPLTVGHEFSGEIAACGAKAQGFAIGQHVTAAPLIPCGTCEACEQGNPAMCTHYSFVGSREAGAMAEYVRVPARNVVPLADSVTWQEGACIEPITVALHGVERVGTLKSGTAAIVYGCGTIGMFTLQCLKAKGIERVYAIDIDDAKLEMAMKLGAYQALNSKKIDIPAYFKEHGLVDYAFETAGVPFLQAQVLELVKKHAAVVYIGTAHGEVRLQGPAFEKILRGELSVTGSWMSYSAPFPGTEWKAAAELLAAGKIKTEGIVTHQFPLSAGIKAFETLTDHSTGAIKVMYVMGE